MDDSDIDPALLRAYRETHFEVLDTTAFTLRIGVASPELVALHGQHGVNASAFVTAFNPFSEALTDSKNDERHASLRDELQRVGLPFLEGLGRHPSSSWPPERSVLVIGLDLAAARELGSRWHQNARDFCEEWIWASHLELLDSAIAMAAFGGGRRARREFRRRYVRPIDLRLQRWRRHPRHPRRRMHPSVHPG